MFLSGYIVSAYNAGHDNKTILANLHVMSEQKVGVSAAIEAAPRHEKVLEYLRKNFNQIDRADVFAAIKAVLANETH